MAKPVPASVVAMLDDSNGLTLLIGGFRAKGMETAREYLRFGDDDIAARLLEVTRAAERLLQQLQQACSNDSLQDLEGIGDVKSRFLELVVRASDIMREWHGRGGGRELQR